MIRKSGHRFSGRAMLNKMGHYRGSICDNGPGLQRVDSGFGASGLMGKITSFLEIDRHDRKYAPVAERVKSYREFVVPLGGAVHSIKTGSRSRLTACTGVLCVPKT